MGQAGGAWLVRSAVQALCSGRFAASLPGEDTLSTLGSRAYFTDLSNATKIAVRQLAFIELPAHCLIFLLVRLRMKGGKGPKVPGAGGSHQR